MILPPHIERILSDALDGMPDPSYEAEMRSLAENVWTTKMNTLANPAHHQFVDAVSREIESAYKKHGREPWGRHEFYAILKEEIDEVWDAIRFDQAQEALLAEIVQVVAMCIRYYETGDRYRGKHPSL